MTALKTLQVDFKSLLIGFLVCGMFITSFAFNAPDTDRDNGRYMVAASEKGFVILDTQSGHYILDQEAGIIGKYRWLKGDFASSFEYGLDKVNRTPGN